MTNPPPQKKTAAQNDSMINLRQEIATIAKGFNKDAILPWVFLMFNLFADALNFFQNISIIPRSHVSPLLKVVKSRLVHRAICWTDPKSVYFIS